MNRVFRQLAAAFVLAAGACATAQSAVINAPSTFSNTSGGWAYSGIGFVANRDSILTHFEFENGGTASTVEFVDGSGIILNSVSIGAGSNATDVDVSWSLLAGKQYYVLGHGGNFRYGAFGTARPSNDDIRLTNTGIFATSLRPSTFYSGPYWSAFNEITTFSGATAVPEPGTPAIFGLGLMACLILRARAGRSKG